MKVSLLIGSRDRVEVLTRCLQSAMTQDYSPLEILILDDNSSKYRFDELLVVKFQDTRLRCFRSDESLGVAKGRNFLMRQATGEIFCVLDDDAYFANDNCISQLIEVFKQQPNVGIVATKIIDHHPNGDTLAVPFSKKWLKKQPNLVNETQPVSYYVGTGHAIHRRVIERCGPYRDELIFGEEELDLSYRTIEAGLEIFYLPDVVVHHHPKPSVVGQQKGERKPELYYHVRNRFFLAHKYLPWLYVPIYLGVWLSAYGLRAFRSNTLQEFFRGIVAGVKTLKKLERTPLSPDVVQYLKTHYGRLWY